MIVPVSFAVISFVNTFLSLDKVHPVTSFTSSFNVTVTITFPFVNVVILYVTFASGFTLSIFVVFVISDLVRFINDLN